MYGLSFSIVHKNTFLFNEVQGKKGQKRGFWPKKQKILDKQDNV
jgi:hypothetical protein